MPQRVRLFAYLTATFNVVVAVVVAVTVPAGLGDDEVAGWSLLSTVVLLAVVVLFQIRPIIYRRRTDGHAIHPTEAFIVALLFTAPLNLIPVLVGGATLAVQALYQRNGLARSSFNVGNTCLISSVGVLCYTLVGAPRLEIGAVPFGATIAAIVIAMMAAEVVLFLGLFSVLDGVRHAWDVGIRQVYLPASAAVVGVAVLTAFAFTDRPLAQVAVLVVLGIVHVLFTATSNAAEARARAEKLTALGSLLADTTRFDANLERFVAGVTELLHARRGVLWLSALRTAVVHDTAEGTSRDDDADGQLVAEFSPALALDEPTLFAAGDASTLAHNLTGRARRAVVRIRYGAIVYGALILDDWDEQATGKTRRRDDLRLLSDISLLVGAACSTAQLLTAHKAKAAELESRQRHTDWLIRHSFTPVAAVDPDGTVAAWSGPLAELTGIASAAAEGRRWHEHLHPVSTAEAVKMTAALSGQDGYVALQTAASVELLCAVTSSVSGHALLVAQTHTDASETAPAGQR